MADLAQWSGLLGGPPPWLVGVVNITPDSFSDGGKFLDPNSAVAHARALREAGAHVIELGAESTGPGSLPIAAEDEQRRLLPVLEQLANEMVIGIDTYRSSTAALALKRGAKVINDVSALRADPEMAATLASANAFAIIMHSKEEADHPHVSKSERYYVDVVAEVSAFCWAQVAQAQNVGLSLDRIAVDSGMGKFLSHDQCYSWELLARFAEFVENMAPLPTMAAVSRKGFLGGTLADRDLISQLVALELVRRGARFVRTHDVAMMRAFLDAERRIGAGRST